MDENVNAKRVGLNNFKNCKGTKSFGFLIVAMHLHGHSLCSMILLFKLIFKPFKIWSASSAILIKLPLATTKHYQKKKLFLTIPCMLLHIENEHPSTLTHYKQKLKIVDESRQCVWQKTKKRKTIFPTSITTFFSSPKHYKPTKSTTIHWGSSFVYKKASQTCWPYQ